MDVLRDKVKAAASIASPARVERSANRLGQPPAHRSAAICRTAQRHRDHARPRCRPAERRPGPANGVTSAPEKTRKSGRNDTRAAAAGTRDVRTANNSRRNEHGTQSCGSRRSSTDGAVSRDPSARDPAPVSDARSRANRPAGRGGARGSAPGGRLGADQARRVHRPAGTGGGADQMARLLQGVVTKNNLMKQPMIVVNKARRRRRRRLPRGQERQGRSAQDHHHAVQPVHHAARHRRAVQLEGPDAGRDAGARPVRAVGQRRDALQDRQGLHRRGQGRRRQEVQDGRHRLQAGRPDHHGGAREGDGAQEVHLRAVQGRRRRRGAAGRQARQLDASTIRSRRCRSGRPARCGRCACSTTSAAVQGEGHRRRWPGTTSRPARRPASTSSTRCCAASSCPPASRRSRSPSTSTCSRRCARPTTGRSSWRMARSTRPS